MTFLDTASLFCRVSFGPGFFVPDLFVFLYSVFRKGVIWENAGIVYRIMKRNLFYNFLKLLKANIPGKRNVDEVLALAGTLDDTDAEEISQIIKEEFSKIDGDWN